MCPRGPFSAAAIGAVLLLSATAAPTASRSQPPSTTSTTQDKPTTTASRCPPGPGRDALFKVCKECHGPESVLGQLKTRDEWSKTLDEMAANGATGTDEEWNSILDYLDAHYSLILVNTAPAKELVLKLGVPAEVADAVVRTRTDKGKFTSIDDLKRVPGMDSMKLDAQKDRLIF
jgi:competence protein ComEA